MPLAVTLNMLFAVGMAMIGFAILVVVMKLDTMLNN